MAKLSKNCEAGLTKEQSISGSLRTGMIIERLSCAYLI